MLHVWAAVIIILLFSIFCIWFFQSHKSKLTMVEMKSPAVTDLSNLKGDEYWFDPILITDRKRDLEQIQSQNQAVLFHLILQEGNTPLYLSKFNDPFNYNRLSYIFEADGKFNRKLYFATLKDAQDVKKKRDVNSESVIVAHKYSQKFMQRLKVETW
jgi:hypothetical protein